MPKLRTQHEHDLLAFHGAAWVRLSLLGEYDTGVDVSKRTSNNENKKNGRGASTENQKM